MYWNACAAAGLLAIGASRLLAQPAPSPRVVALLDDCRIAIYDTRRDAEPVVKSLGSCPAWAVTQSMALSNSGDVVFVPLVQVSTNATSITRLGLSDYAVRTVAVLRDSMSYPWLAVGPRRGKLYLLTNFGLRLRVVDPADTSTNVQFASGRDVNYGEVMSMAISAREDRVIASYHGAAASLGGGSWGVDWIGIKGSTFTVCDAPVPKAPGLRSGCINGHGDVFAYGDDILTGNSGPDFLIFDAEARQRRKVPSGIGNIHLMQFAVDTVKQVAYSIAPCRSIERILGRAQLREGDTIPASSAIGSGVCGQHVAASPNGAVVAVASESSISVVDVATGAVVKTFAAPAKVRDIIIVPN